MTVRIRLLISAATVFKPIALFVVSFTAFAQPVPPIGKIDFYGLKTLSPQQILERVSLHVGDPTPVDRQPELEQKLEQTPGVTKAKVTGVCCEDGKTTVFIGVQEQAGPKFEYNPAPNGTVTLPPDLAQTYDELTETLTTETLKGRSAEDDSQGHPLYSSEALKRFPEAFQSFANSQTDLLKQALRTARDPKQRAIAAWILPYAADKGSVIDDLMQAVRDPDEGVRNNATRALGTIAVLARRRPELRLRIGPNVFIQMLNSLSWSDRNKATMVLLELTAANAPEILNEMRQQALPALIEMARWQDGHSLMALRLVGRIAEISDQETEVAWKTGRREEIIKKGENRIPKSDRGVRPSRPQQRSQSSGHTLLPTATPR